MTMKISTMPESDRERQVALRGFQRDRRRHCAGEAFDIAADDDDRADFRRGAAEAGQQRGDQREAGVPDQRGDAAGGPDIHRGELVAVFEPEIFDGLTRQRGDDRRDQDRLRDDHRLRREENAEITERSRTRQQEINRETDQHGRQAHQRVEHDDHAGAAGETRQRDGRSQRNADDAGEQRGRQTHKQRQTHDGHQRRIGGEHHVKRGGLLHCQFRRHVTCA